MKSGRVILIRLPQAAAGPQKLRPALVLTTLPGPYQNRLICGISTQLHESQAEWDDLIDAHAPDFAESGLQRTSLIRLSYLYAAVDSEIVGAIGSIAPARLDRLRQRLIQRLQT